MRKTYLDVYPFSTIKKAHTVKTFDNEIFINCWNGDFIPRVNPKKRLSSWKMYHNAKNIECDGLIIASRVKGTQHLRYLARPIRIKCLV